LSQQLNIETEYYLQRIKPDYPPETTLVTLKFNSEAEFEFWFKDVALHHAGWVKQNTNFNKGNAKVVSSMTTEQRDMCILTKETRYWYCEASGTHVTTVASESRKRKRKLSLFSLDIFKQDGCQESTFGLKHGDLYVFYSFITVTYCTEYILLISRNYRMHHFIQIISLGLIITS
jgi:hypothetical protein